MYGVDLRRNLRKCDKHRTRNILRLLKTGIHHNPKERENHRSMGTPQYSLVFKSRRRGYLFRETVLRLQRLHAKGRHS